MVLGDSAGPCGLAHRYSIHILYIARAVIAPKRDLMTQISRPKKVILYNFSKLLLLNKFKSQQIFENQIANYRIYTKKNQKCILIDHNAPSLCFICVHFNVFENIKFALLWRAYAPIKNIKSLIKLCGAMVTYKSYDS